MTCDICKNREAAIFFQQADADFRVVREVHLCPDCARERGIRADGEKIEISLAGLIPQLRAAPHPDEGKRCPVCGLDLRRVKEARTLGCPECYEFFKNDIKEVQEREGVRGEYTGALPRRFGQNKAALSERLLFQSKLEESLATEDYERAALYRDKLRELEGVPSCAKGETR
jgi:protein arginine kinase activator